MQPSDTGGPGPEKPGEGFADGTGERYRPVTGMPPVAEADMFRSIATSSRGGLVVSDLDGGIVWVNARLEQMVGRERAELIGEPFTLVLSEEGHDAILEVRARLLAGEDVGTIRSTGRHRDGRVFPVTATPGVREDATGRRLGVVTILHDISEQVRLERELDEALGRFRARFDAVGIAQAALDLHGRFLEVNDAACRLVGRSRADLLGREVLRLGPPEDVAAVRRRAERVIRGEVAAVSYETAVVLPDGTRRPILIDLSVARDADGVPAEVVCFARDLSEIRAAERRLETQQRFFRTLYERSPDPALVTDGDGRIRFASPAFEHALGVGPDVVVGDTVFDHVHPEDVASSRRWWGQVRASAGETMRLTVRVEHAAGRWPWFEVTAANRLDDPEIGGVVVNLREVDAEIMAQRAQRALRDSEARYRAIVETAQEGILVLDGEGRVAFVNQRGADLLGLSLEEARGVDGARLLARPAADAPARRPGPTTQEDRYDVRYRHPDGEVRTFDVSVGPLGRRPAEPGADDDVPGPTGVVAMVSDVTEARRSAADLERRALHDPLTGLANRTLLVDRLQVAVARASRSPHGVIALLYLDLDHFKDVNDRHGHEAGDQLLVQVGGRLRAALRESDTVARLGGDEFAVVCEEADPLAAEHVAARLRAALKEPMLLPTAGPVEIGVSIGVATSPPRAAEHLLRSADAAMYRAKAAGRGRVVVDVPPRADPTERERGVADGGPNA